MIWEMNTVLGLNEDGKGFGLDRAKLAYAVNYRSVSVLNTNICSELIYGSSHVSSC